MYIYRTRPSGLTEADWVEHDLRDGPDALTAMVAAAEDPFTQLQILNPQSDEWVAGPSIDELRALRDSLISPSQGREAGPDLTSVLTRPSAETDNAAYQRGYIAGLERAEAESAQTISELRAEIDRLNTLALLQAGTGSYRHDQADLDVTGEWLNDLPANPLPTVESTLETDGPTHTTEEQGPSAEGAEQEGAENAAPSSGPQIAAVVETPKPQAQPSQAGPRAKVKTKA